MYEPVLSDLRRPEHFTRDHGPPGDPDVYLSSMRERVADVGLTGVDTVAIPDPVSISAGLEQHIADAPAAARARWRAPRRESVARSRQERARQRHVALVDRESHKLIRTMPWRQAPPG